MLGGIHIADRDPGREVIDQDGAGLFAGQGGADALGVLGRRHPALQGLVDGVGQGEAVGDQDAGGEGIVLGLADQVGGHVLGVGAVVGEDGDLGRAGLGVDADQALQDPLGGDDPDIARPGDH